MTGRVEQMSGSLAGTPGSDGDEPEPSTAGPALRLLLVEDDAHDAYAVRRALRKSEPAFEIIHCTRAEDALDRVTSEAAAFDVALVDYGLPGMSGMELCYQLLGAEVPFPLVMLTGTGTERLAVEALRSGVFDYVIKDSNAGYLALLPSTLAKAVHRRTDRVERRRAEEALRESEERYRALVQGQADPICRTLPGGTLLFVNDAYCRYFRKTADELVGTSFLRFIPEESHRFVLDNLASLSVDKPTQTHEHEVISPKGERRWQQWTNTAMFDEKGEVIEMVAIGRDTTERKRTEESLRESEDRLRRSVLDAPIPIMIHAEGGEVLMISKKWTELSGYSHADMPNILDWTEKAYGADREHMRNLIGRLYEIEGPFEDEASVTTARGERRTWDFRTAPLGRLPDGRRFVISMAVDITERKVAEAALRESEARLRTTVGNLVEGVATIDESGIIESFNPAAERMFGYSAEDVIGRNVKLLMPEPDRGKHGGYIRRYLESGEARIVGSTREGTGRRKDGTIFPLDLGVAEMRLGDQRLFVGTLRDITERKRAEAERERLEAQLRQAQKMEAVGTLAGGIAHDFNNILAGMTGYAHLAIDAVPAKSQVRGDLEQILKSIDRATSLVRQILAFSRRSDAERHPVEIGRVVEEALQLLRASIPATIEIHRKIDREAGTVMADATQLQRVVMNFCTNAADAIGPGPGTIEVKLAGVELGAADTATRPDLAPGSYVKLSVSDSGVGMDAATQARIFEPFFTTKEPGKGTGLGLAVAHGIVRKHGGTIEVDSEPGRGTTMTVLLPRAEVVERDAARADRDIPRGRERILLIDDEAAIARSEARLLERLGYRVEAATSSVRALEAFRAAPEAFDLVITDQAMPELPGMALAREILKARGDIPIILRSGYADALGTEDAMAAGIREFMLKPIHPDDLARAVRRALDGDAKGGDEGHGTGSGNR